MKKYIVLLVLAITIGFNSYGQKFAYVDTDYILKNIPEFTDAQSQIDEMSKQWQKEIEAKFVEVDKMYKEFQADALLMPEETKRKKENEIIATEKEAKAMQMQKFGQNGELFKKRQELVKPIQEKIFKAINEISTERNFAIVFDKAGSVTVLYSNNKYDISDDVLEKLGYGYNIKK